MIYFKGTIRYRNIKQMENKKQKVKDTQIDTSYRKQKRQKGKQKKTESKRHKLIPFTGNIRYRKVEQKKQKQKDKDENC